MGLSDDLAAIEPVNGGVEPLYRRLIRRLSDEERGAFLAALEDPERVSAPQLSRVMRDNGHVVSASSIRSWRRGEAL